MLDRMSLASRLGVGAVLLALLGIVIWSVVADDAALVRHEEARTSTWQATGVAGTIDGDWAAPDEWERTRHVVVTMRGADCGQGAGSLIPGQSEEVAVFVQVDEERVQRTVECDPSTTIRFVFDDVGLQSLDTLAWTVGHEDVSGGQHEVQWSVTVAWTAMVDGAA